jgi:hypothetical protein
MRIMHPITWWKSAACGFAVMLSIAPAVAQDLQNWRAVRADDYLDFGLTLPSREELSSIDVDPAVRALVQKLDDVSFFAREEATQALLNAEVDRNQLYAMLEFDALSAEQRYRLLAVVRETLTRMPRGALGISMRQLQFAAAGPVEIRVEDLLPGLPAERVLRIGDSIIAFDGKPLLAQRDLQTRIQSKKPGEKATLTIKRVRVDEAGQPMLDEQNRIQLDTLDVEIELGSAELLRNTAPNSPVFDQTSDVERQRHREAAAEAHNYAPKAREIPIKGSFSAMSTQNQSNPRRRSASPGAIDVDDHPLIRDLLEQRLMIAQGQRALTPAVRQQWNQTLSKLLELAANDNLTPDERALLADVIDRYVELIGE